MNMSNDHQCVCSSALSKQTILLRRKNDGDTGTAFLTSHFIVFVARGAARYTIGGERVTVDKDRFFFLPQSANVVWEAVGDTTVLMFRIDDLVGKLPECPSFRFQRLAGELPVEKGFHLLTADERFRPFLEDVTATLQEGFACANYARHLVAVLLARIQFHYTPEEYLRFYSSVASPDVLFSDTVYKRWMDCRTVRQLACELNMTVRRFTPQFHRAFGESPGTWLKKRHREYVYRDICNSTMPLQEIAIKHGVSLTNFVRYCRQNYGSTPKRIRASLMYDKTA